MLNTKGHQQDFVLSSALLLLVFPAQISKCTTPARTDDTKTSLAPSSERTTTGNWGAHAI